MTLSDKMIDQKESNCEILPKDLLVIKQLIFEKCGFKISQIVIEKESAAYSACTFLLDAKVVLFRSAKITPTKAGQFVTLWKRNDKGPIQPFDETDKIDCVIIAVRSENHFGHFVFPKNILINKGILSSKNAAGKRAIRVYPPWDVVKNKQAIKTQQWQLNRFLNLSEGLSSDLKKAIDLFQS
jgi:hypothetical protein